MPFAYRRGLINGELNASATRHHASCSTVTWQGDRALTEPPAQSLDGADRGRRRPLTAELQHGTELLVTGRSI